MKVYKYVLLTSLSDIITLDLVEHSTSVIDDFCVVTRSRYRPRASVGIPDVGERILPYI